MPYGIREPARVRFWRFVRKTETCWIWRGALTNGYGRFNTGVTDGRRAVFAHRYAWELKRGPIPDGMVLDHLCGNRACCNPDHLDLVSMNENARRGDRHRVQFDPVADESLAGQLELW